MYSISLLKALNMHDISISNGVCAQGIMHDSEILMFLATFYTIRAWIYVRIFLTKTCYKPENCFTHETFLLIVGQMIVD